MIATKRDGRSVVSVIARGGEEEEARNRSSEAKDP